MKRSLLIIIQCVIATAALAQKLTADGPSSVMVNEQFRIAYTVDTQDAKDFGIGTVPDAFEVLIGPNASYQSSYRIVNGQTSSSQTITYTYVLYANKKGTFTISPAHVTAGGKKIESGALQITVTDNINGNAAAGSAGRSGGQSRRKQQQRQQPSRGSSSGTTISPSDLFIKVSANKRHVCEQEPILLTYKVYTLVDLTQMSGKMPDLTGFHTQEIPLPQQKSFKVETYEGKAYHTVTWSQYVMFPQKTGKLEIPSITFDGVVAVRNRNVDPFEAFFNGGAGYTEVKHSIKAPGLTITVDPLPTRPADFSGGVGKFSMTAKIDKTQTKTNEPITIKVTVSGTGNMKLLKTPEVNFPAEFDTYDVKTTDKTKLTTAGVEGSMVYEFLAVPRSEGSYDIPPIKFVYYDLNTKSYKTLSSETFTVDVEKNPDDNAGTTVVSSGSGVQEETDIRGIKIDPANVKSKETIFFRSTTYNAVIALMVAVFIALFIIFRHSLTSNPDMAGRRERRANKIAGRRLRTARRLMLDNKQNEFYDEVLRTLWGYISDKLHMPVEQLARENISQELAGHDVKDEIIAKFIEALDECEFERYAPGDVKGNMNKTYDTAMSAITQIEEGMRHRPRRKKTESVGAVVILSLALAAACACPSAADAMTKDDADSLYLAKKYKEAIGGYEDILKKEKSAEVYYNLGNAYYRTGNNTRAILCYERARLYSPSDEDIRHNLKIAQGKTTDKIVARPKAFFIEWISAAMDMQDMDGWAKSGIVALAVAIVMSILYFFSGRVGVRKLGFTGIIVFVIVFIVATTFAYKQYVRQTENDEAIVTAPFALIKKSPSTGSSDLFMLHEGTKVEILDGELNDWKEIRVSDGRKGWIETSKLEKI